MNTSLKSAVVRRRSLIFGVALVLVWAVLAMSSARGVAAQKRRRPNRRRAADRFQLGRPADPRGQLFPLSWASDKSRQAGLRLDMAERPTRSEEQAGPARDRAREAGRERAHSPHHGPDTRRPDAAAARAQGSYRGASRYADGNGSSRARSTSRIGRSSRRRGPPCRRTASRRAARTTSIGSCSRGSSAKGSHPRPKRTRRR